MAKVGKYFLITLACGLLGVAHADTLQMGGTGAAADSRFEDSGKPTRGMTKGSVEANFGNPANRQSPVGDPPISRWEYANFVVYFEYDRVIHSVRKRS